jgi:hypothetical protein
VRWDSPQFGAVKPELASLAGEAGISDDIALDARGVEPAARKLARTLRPALFVANTLSSRRLRGLAW